MQLVIKGETMYYIMNMQTGKQDRPVYQDGDVFQNKETGEQGDKRTRRQENKETRERGEL